MKFALNNSPVAGVQTDCLVIGIIDNTPLSGTAAEIDELSGGQLQRLLDSGDIEATWKDKTLLHHIDGVSAKRILVMGCGDAKKFTPARFDSACAMAAAFLRDHVTTSAHFCLHELETTSMEMRWRVRQTAISAEQGNYRYITTKAPKPYDNDPMVSATIAADSSFNSVLKQAQSIAKGYLRSRQLGNLPPNICNPAFLAEQAQEMADQYDNVSLTVLKSKEMKELGMRALLAVGRGSANGPRLIVLKYDGAGDDSQPFVLVGKGITFDTGGISIKPGPNMEQMKFDMGGAASVLGAFEACVDMKLPINLITVVAAAENMPDGKAYRPGDVITSMAGLTIEVLNTDAEGRMVLCDALTYSKRFNPKAIIDVATLTGAAVVALGHHASAVMSKHDDLADALVEAGQQVVDRGWRLPLWDDYQVQLKSNFADMKNVGGMAAGSITAACFLSRFTEDLNWAHIDCAGSTWVWGSDKSSTGRPVGLLTQYLINQAS
jgi:leucyl aminopeptidase